MMNWARYQVACLAALFAITASANAATIFHAFDLEPADGPTEPGWTHIQSNTFANPGFTTAGLVQSESFPYYSATRVSSTIQPFDVTRDVIGFTAQGNLNSNNADDPAGMRFFEVVPANVSSALITIYRGDSGDGATAVYNTTVSLNGGSQTTIHTGGQSGNELPPIVYTQLISPSLSTGTLDLRFLSDTQFAGIIRISGISFEYTIVPEPSSVFVLLGSSVGVLFALRRRASRHI